MSSRVLAACLLFAISQASAFQEKPKTEEPLTHGQLAESTQADAYFVQSNYAAAELLYQKLAQERPESILFAERNAFCVYSRAHDEKAGEERDRLVALAMKEAKRAQSLGGQDNLLKIMLGGMSAKAVFPGDLSDEMKVAEAAFRRGDLDGALEHYKNAAAANPKLYEAPLFAGDMYFRKHDAAQAGEWFQKAIAVDPNRETAYRYWGDALLADRELEAARDKFIDAIVAEPYSQRSIVGLQQWAKATGASLRNPDVKRPRAPEQKNGQTNIVLDADSMKDLKSGSAAWLMYPMTRVLWQTKEFVATHPEEKTYRHSLAEEKAALESVLLSLKEQKIKPGKLDPSFADLLKLDADRMLEPFILISLVDDGIAKDYVPYRDAHWEQIHAYIAKYVIHFKEAANK